MGADSSQTPSQRVAATFALGGSTPAWVLSGRQACIACVHACTLVGGRAVQQGRLELLAPGSGRRRGQKGNKGPDLNAPPSQRFGIANRCSIGDLIAQNFLLKPGEHHVMSLPNPPAPSFNVTAGTG
jgi:hypothetical protein